MQKLEEMAAQVSPELWCMLLVRPGKNRMQRTVFAAMACARIGLTTLVSFAGHSPARASSHRFPIDNPRLYLCAGATDGKFWDVVARNVGIVKVVRNYSGELAVLRNADIEVIREIERWLNTPVPGKTLHHFKTGDKVRFTDDILSRWPPGRIASATNDGHLVVEVEVMGSTVPVHVFPHQIERA